MLIFPSSISLTCSSVFPFVSVARNIVASKPITDKPVKKKRLVKKYVDGVVTVSDENIAYALFKLLEREKVLVEPSGAAGLAALFENKIDVKGKKVVIVLSGGNVNFLLLSNIIYRALEMENKLLRLEFNLPDHPGIMEKSP